MGNPPDYDPILEGLRSMRFTYYVWFVIHPTVECVVSTPSARKYLVKITPRNYFNVVVEKNQANVTTTHTCTFPCALTISPTSMQWTYLQDVIQQHL